MTIEVDPEVIIDIRERASELRLLVTGCLDRVAAGRAISDLIADIHRMPSSAGGAVVGDAVINLTGPSFVDGPFERPDGVYFYLDGKDLVEEALGSIPLRLADHLRRRGVSDARITFPDDQLPPPLTTGTAVLLYLLPDPAGPGLPAAWLEAASTWIGVAEDLVWTSADFASFSVPTFEAQNLARRGSARWTRLVGPDYTGVLRAVSTMPTSGDPFVALGAGNLRSRAEVESMAREMIELGRRLAPEGAYAFVTIDPDLRAMLDARWGEFRHRSDELLTGLGRPPWGPEERTIALRDRSDTPVAPTKDAFRFPHALVADAFPWQMIGPRHADLLGGEPVGAEPIRHDRWEMEIGALEDWLDPHRCGPIVTLGRRRLAPFLLTPRQKLHLHEEWRRRPR
jgi:hypothetical protein